MVGLCSDGVPATSYCPTCFGGLVSLTRGMPTAMGVSDRPGFRGGGGGEAKVLGVYDVLVCILRLEDIWDAPAEEKVLVRLWQGLIERRTRAGDEVIGMITR